MIDRPEKGKGNPLAGLRNLFEILDSPESSPCGSVLTWPGQCRQNRKKRNVRPDLFGLPSRARDDAALLSKS
jgi:hypothetical protein